MLNPCKEVGALPKPETLKEPWETSKDLKVFVTSQVVQDFFHRQSVYRSMRFVYKRNSKKHLSFYTLEV